MFRFASVGLLSVALTSLCARAQNPPASNSKALGYAAQSIALLTGGNPVRDVTLTGNVTLTAGDDGETGTATLLALGTGESRIELSLPSGTRTEIRDAQSGTLQGKWIKPNGASGRLASHNCLTDAVWFFPALTSLSGGTNVIFSYIGQETRHGASVQHLRSYIYDPSHIHTRAPNLRSLSTMDFYLDSATLLPSAITFKVHPDNNAASNIPVEVDFSDYQIINGVLVPMHIEKYMQGTLMIDLKVSSATFNAGTSLSSFTVN